MAENPGRDFMIIRKKQAHNQGLFDRIKTVTVIKRDLLIGIVVENNLLYRSS